MKVSGMVKVSGMEVMKVCSMEVMKVVWLSMENTKTSNTNYLTDSTAKEDGMSKVPHDLKLLSDDTVFMTGSTLYQSHGSSLTH